MTPFWPFTKGSSRDNVYTMQGPDIAIWINKTDDWSIELMGQRLEHVSAKLIDDLVEYALIVTESSLAESEPGITDERQRVPFLT